MRLADGELLWKTKYKSSSRELASFLMTSSAMMVAMHGRLVAIEPKDGLVEWESKLPKMGTTVIPMHLLCIY